MEALRFVVCGRPECRQVFFLCSACDRGHRYCGPPCSRRARAESMRAAGARYQRTRDGRHAHAARQAAWRERRRQKVTHQSPAAAAQTASVPVAPAPAATQVAAEPSAARPLPHAPPPSIPACTWCGRQSPFLRHTTLARTHVGRRFRAARPP
ncbi:hypothetical protein [Archangium lansingense]|uniref:Uncharacterized protein n=2 Tax=Archangium lansingense TaxID=2995310 RepID=A0ABT4ABF2_9BACT|nr:hypothetical protein [Archangium lansinium]MCY1078989.1 hypothetical protein [Archangium lansinium]